MAVTLPEVGATGWGTIVNAAFDEFLSSGRDALEYPLYDKGGQVFNLAAYSGADPTGASDSDSAWTSAYADAVAAGAGSIIEIPHGATFRIATKKTLADPITIEGSGTIKAKASGWVSGDPILDITGAGVQVKGITLDQDNASAGKCIRVNGGTRAVIDDVKSANVQQAFVQVVGAFTDVTIRNCRHTGRGYGIWVQEPSAGATGLYVYNNVLRFSGTANSADGIEVNCPTNGMADVIIAGNRVIDYPNPVSNTGLGIALAKVSNGIIYGNLITGCANDGIHVEDGSSLVTIVGNTVRACGATGGSAAIMLTDSSFCTVQGNILEDIAAMHGILLWGLSGTQIEGNVVSGNTIRSVDKAGIVVSISKRTVVANNVITGADLDTPGTFAAIHFRRIDAQTVDNDNCIITGNICADGASTMRGGIEVAGGDLRMAITNNNLVGVGSAIKIQVNGAVWNLLRGNWHGTSRLTGTFTATAGTSSVVANTNAYATDRVRVWPANAGAAGLTGVFVSSVSAGSSFTVTHATAAGTEVFNYEITG